MCVVDQIFSTNGKSLFVADVSVSALDTSFLATEKGFSVVKKIASGVPAIPL